MCHICTCIIFTVFGNKKYFWAFPDSCTILCLAKYLKHDWLISYFFTKDACQGNRNSTDMVKLSRVSYRVLIKSRRCGQSATQTQVLHFLLCRGWVISVLRKIYAATCNFTLKEDSHCILCPNFIKFFQTFCLIFKICVTLDIQNL